MDISVEQLAMEAQAGAKESLYELWENVRRYVIKVAFRWDRAFNGRSGVTADDLINTGYLALVEAVEGYQTEKGAFLHWFTYYLKKHFLGCYGLRTSKKDLLNEAMSLDVPITEDGDDVGLYDVVADPAGLLDMESAEEHIFQDQLHDAVEEALDDIPESYARVLRSHYLEGKTLAETGASEGISHAAAWHREKQGIRHIKSGRNAAKLWDYYSLDPYRGTGLTSFERTGSSSQELYVMQKERIEWRLGRGPVYVGNREQE